MWKSHALICLALSSFGLALPAATSQLEEDRSSAIGSTVELDYGTFHGLEDRHNGIISFRGVRFADAPVGNLRFRAPVSPPSTHLGDVEATKFGKACIQATQTSVDGGTSEDCLFGNIYVPINSFVDDRLPVVVWFHGGGFQDGSTHDTSPESLMKSSSAPMIFASFEYRLGALGFLGGIQVHGDGDLNAGFLDQRAALRWVQRYIGQFGGDKSKVTIWGQSAGAGSTMFHLIANGGDTEGLFQAAMGDSPSLTFTPEFDGKYAEHVFNQYATFSGCGDQGSNTLNCLRSASARDLERGSSMVVLAARTSTLFVFSPILDGALLRNRPVEAFSAGQFANVPVLFGSNTDEGANWSGSLRNRAANTMTGNATEDTVFNFIHGQYPTATRGSIDQAFNLYPLESGKGAFDIQGQQMYGDVRYICTAAMITGSVSRSSAAFHYHYDNPHLGSLHKDELDAFFSPPGEGDKNDQALFEAMREYFTSFITTGTPSASASPTWERVTASNGSPRILFNPEGIRMEQIDDTLNARCNFWHGISAELET